MKNVSKETARAGPSAAKAKVSKPPPSPTIPNKVQDIPLHVECDGAGAEATMIVGIDRPLAVAAPLLPPAMRIGAGDEIVVDLSTSCTKDVAVAKLLGWMRGPIRRRLIEITADGISIDQMPYLHTLEGSLAAQLAEFRAAAQRKLFEAFEADASDAAMNDLEKEVNRCNDLIYMAAQYLRDIDDELEKGQESALVLDQAATAKSGVVYIALSSLNRWAIFKYTIEIIEDYSRLCSKIQNPVSDPKPSVADTFDEEFLPKGFESAYASFGFLLAAFAVRDKEHLRKGAVNVNSITKVVIDQLEVNLKVLIDGQSADSIRKTFGRATRAMDSKLRECRTNQVDYLKAVEK